MASGEIHLSGCIFFRHRQYSYEFNQQHHIVWASDANFLVRINEVLWACNEMRRCTMVTPIAPFMWQCVTTINITKFIKCYIMAMMDYDLTIDD